MTGFYFGSSVVLEVLRACNWFLPQNPEPFHLLQTTLVDGHFASAGHMPGTGTETLIASCLFLTELCHLSTQWLQISNFTFLWIMEHIFFCLFAPWFVEGNDISLWLSLQSPSPWVILVLLWPGSSLMHKQNWKSSKHWVQPVGAPQIAADMINTDMPRGGR